MSLIQELEDYLKQKVPMIDYAGLVIVTLNMDQSIVKICLTPQNKNHLNSMYFGSLAIGADAAGGLLPLYQIKQQKINSTVVFKDFKANFIRRPESDVYFVCNEGVKVHQALMETVATKQRINFPVNVVAVLDPKDLSEPVATFILTVSVKCVDL